MSKCVEHQKTFKLIIDHRPFEWSKQFITGAQIKELAGVDPSYGVWQELPGPDDEKIDLQEPGRERFLTKPKYFVCIEGEIFPWPDNTITTEEIIKVGGWDPDQGVIEVDQDQNERTLQPEEVIELKPGISFGKRVCWKRG